ncbi:MAG TPA: hypothetical protein RMH99_14330 [Sandaracinaceae bacterium LLY-WYZ-13_1]|nr:hypothetical protein [Sandaracinaceae bacterium LLY-WYZ-13_1]
MRRLVVAALLLLPTACDDPPPLERSCQGNTVDLCAPREYAEVAAASLDPSALPVADFSETASIRVELERCEDAPAPHVVVVEALVPTDLPDGGTGAQVMNLLTLEPGADGDPPGDDVIEVEVTNPFIATIPPETDITLRFTARSAAIAGCSSGALEVPYRTGPRRE